LFMLFVVVIGMFNAGILGANQSKKGPFFLHKKTQKWS
jgi:hypothetical protein